MQRASLVLAVLAVGLLFASGTTAQEVQPERTITVTGRGVTRVPYTDAVFNLGVQVEARTASEAQAQLRERLSSVVSQLKQLQVQRLQTAGVQLYPRYEQKPGSDTSKIVGYTASSTVQFQVPVAEAGRVLDSSVAGGANLVQGLSFILSDEEQKKARAQALALAVADARSQAEVVLDTLGLKLRQLRAIQVGGGPQISPIRPLARAAAAELAAAATPIEGGQAEVDATVTLQYIY